MSKFFSSVVKTVQTRSVELKKLTYTYIARYADENETCRELALLSINSFQKDLSDRNPLIRALALRALTSLRVRAVSRIQLAAAKRCASDRSPYVRKIAAHAIPKLFRADPDLADELRAMIAELFADKETMVLSSAVAAFAEVCPSCLEMMHPFFRTFCEMLADLDEWGQIVMLEQLLRYARVMLPPPSRSSSQKRRSFYDDDDDGVVRSAESSSDDDEDSDDLDRLVRSSLPLLRSRNAGVVLAVVSLLIHTEPNEELGKGTDGIHASRRRRAANALMLHLATAQHASRYVILENVVRATESSARWCDAFRPSLHAFFVSATDPIFVRRTKLRVLCAIADRSNAPIVLREMETYCAQQNETFVVDSIRAVGDVARRCGDSVAARCLRGLTTLAMRRQRTRVVSASVLEICRLLLWRRERPDGNVERDEAETTETTRQTVESLATLLRRSREPAARASVVWTVGEFAADFPNLVPDVLREMATRFGEESVEVKIQVLNLALRLRCGSSENSRERLLFRYVLELAEYDADYDVRDRARLLRGVLSRGPDRSIGHVFFASKTVAEERVSSTTNETMLGSTSVLAGTFLRGYDATLPPWSEKGTDASLRDVLPTRRRQVRSCPSRERRNVDDFYTDDSDDRSEDEDSDEDSEDVSSSEEESSDDSDDSDDSADSSDSADGDSSPHSEEESSESSESVDAEGRVGDGLEGVFG